MRVGSGSSPVQRVRSLEFPTRVRPAGSAGRVRFALRFPLFSRKRALGQEATFLNPLTVHCAELLQATPERAHSAECIRGLSSTVFVQARRRLAGQTAPHISSFRCTYRFQSGGSQGFLLGCTSWGHRNELSSAAKVASRASSPREAARGLDGRAQLLAELPEALSSNERIHVLDGLSERTHLGTSSQRYYFRAPKETSSVACARAPAVLASG